MTQRGFETLQERFEERFGEMDEKITTMRHEMATKMELQEVEQRLVDAINGIEVKRPEFEALVNDVDDLSHRVRTLEQKH